MAKVTLRVRPTLPFYGLYIGRLLTAIANRNPESFSVGQWNFSLLHKGRADDIICAARGDGVKAEGAEDVPSRHLPAVFIAGEPVGRIGVLGA